MIMIFTSWSDLFGPGVETRLPSWWWEVVVVVFCWCSRQDYRCSSGPQQTVNSLQLTLWQDEAVDLLLTAGTRHHDPTHQHRVGLLLLLRLKTGKSSVFNQLGEGRVWWVPRVLSHYPSSMNSQENEEMMGCDSLSVAALTLTNVVEGNVAKSDDTRAPGWWLTTCSATSSWQRRDGEEDILI